MKEKRQDYEKLVIALNGDGNNVGINAELFAGGISTKGEGSQGNIFLAVDNALKKIIEQL